MIERWQAETGVEIQQIFFDSGDKRDEILAKPDHQIDIALTELISSSRFGARKLLEPIEQARLPALRHVARRWRDSCGRYAVPYLWARWASPIAATASSRRHAPGRTCSNRRGRTSRTS